MFTAIPSTICHLITKIFFCLCRMSPCGVARPCVALSPSDKPAVIPLVPFNLSRITSTSYMLAISRVLATSQRKMEDMTSLILSFQFQRALTGKLNHLALYLTTDTGV